MIKIQIQFKIIKTIIKQILLQIPYLNFRIRGIENYEEVVNFITQNKSFRAKIAIDDLGQVTQNFEHILKFKCWLYKKIDGSLIKIQQDKKT